MIKVPENLPEPLSEEWFNLMKKSAIDKALKYGYAVNIFADKYVYFLQFDYGSGIFPKADKLVAKAIPYCEGGELKVKFEDYRRNT